MKNHFYPFFLCCLLATGSLKAQSFTEPGNMISFGYGYPDAGKRSLNILQDFPGLKRYGMGPFHLKFEKVKDNAWGFGAGLNISRFGAEWNDSGYKASLEAVAFSLLFRANKYHHISEKLQLYSGFGIGYRGRFTTFSTTRPGGYKSEEVASLTDFDMPVGFELTLGLRYAVHPKVAVYTEAGLAKSMIQGGLSIRL